MEQTHIQTLAPPDLNSKDSVLHLTFLHRFRPWRRFSIYRTSHCSRGLRERTQHTTYHSSGEPVHKELLCPRDHTNLTPQKVHAVLFHTPLAVIFVLVPLCCLPTCRGHVSELGTLTQCFWASWWDNKFTLYSKFCYWSSTTSWEEGSRQLSVLCRCHEAASHMCSCRNLATTE